MVTWPIPKTLKALRGFLGLTGYYRRFVHGYSSIAGALTEQLENDKFNWGPEAQLAFDKLKVAMTTVPVLALPDFRKEFIVETDASGFGINAVLMQNKRKIAFYSQTLTPRARLNSVYEHELMAIVLAIQKWRPYLLGRKFVLRTDQRSLKFLLEQRFVAEYHQNWLSKLLGYTFDIQFRPGVGNKAADALSHRVEPSLSSFSVPIVVDKDALLIENSSAEELVLIRTALTHGDFGFHGYSENNGSLLYHGRLVLLRTYLMIPRLLQEFHGTAIGGHSGVTKTYRRLAKELYWVGMKKDVESMVIRCDVCQRHKYLEMAPGGLLQPLELPDKVWADISMDFIEGLPKSYGYTIILVVVDRLTKYSHFILLRHPYTAVTVASVFLREIVRLHGLPESIVSDHDKVFLS